MDSRMQVLVVEDDEIIRDLVNLVLSGEGYDVVVAPHGKDALDRLQQSSPDVILLDMCMPIMDGWEFARAYRMTPGPHAPIVVLTSAHHPVSPDVAVGADGYLQKPFDLEDLVQLVKRYRRRKVSAP